MSRRNEAHTSPFRNLKFCLGHLREREDAKAHFWTASPTSRIGSSRHGLMMRCAASLSQEGLGSHHQPPTSSTERRPMAAPPIRSHRRLLAIVAILAVCARDDRLRSIASSSRVVQGLTLHADSPHRGG